MAKARPGGYGGHPVQSTGHYIPSVKEQDGQRTASSRVKLMVPHRGHRKGEGGCQLQAVTFTVSASGSACCTESLTFSRLLECFE